MNDYNRDHYTFPRSSGLRAHDFQKAYPHWKKRGLSTIIKLDCLAALVLLAAVLFLNWR